MVWLDVGDAKKEGNFVTSEGTAVSYFHWRNGEPNNINDEDCVQVSTMFFFIFFCKIA